MQKKVFWRRKNILQKRIRNRSEFTAILICFFFTDAGCSVGAVRTLMGFSAIQNQWQLPAIWNLFVVFLLFVFVIFVSEKFVFRNVFSRVSHTFLYLF